MRAGETFLAYDPDLGWAPRRGARSTTAPFHANSDGLRAEREYAPEPPAGTLRVAVFGDSFAFGDEVGPDDTWAAALERGLAARGVAAEVLNFGVNAYGMDQAYLRWRRDGRRFHPHVVVFGLQPENVLRNRNVFRPLYYAGTEVPLSKPRFVLRDEGELDLVNVPALPPDRLPGILAAMPADPLFAHERYLTPWFESAWWQRSVLASTVATVLATRSAAVFQLDDEGRALASRLAARFAADVAADGAAFLVVHLPRKEDVATIRAGSAPWYDALLGDLQAGELTVADPIASVAAIDDASFAPRGHYAPALNAALGTALVAPVLAAASERGAERHLPN